MIRARRWIAIGLAATLLRSPLQAQEPSFSEQLTIREREILVDLPDRLADDRLAPGDFQVLVDGQSREVTRAEPVSSADGPAPWTMVVYIDRVLASPGTVFYSALALSNHARDLTRLGTVEVVVAGSDPIAVLAPTGEFLSLAQTLAALAAEARIERDRSQSLLRSRGPSPLQVRRQLDKLVSFLTSRRPSGPHAVFFVADGLDLSPEEMEILEREPPPGGTETPAAAFSRAARLLAAYGWIALPVPLRKEGVGIGVSPQRGIEIFRQGAAPSDHQISVPPILPGRSPRKTMLAFPGVIDLFMMPETAVLRALSQATAGTVIGFEEQIGPTLNALSRRWRVWLAEPDGPVDGRLHPLEVRLPGKTTAVRAPGWLRSSTPEGVAEARLENLLASGRDQSGDLPVKVAARETPAGLELHFEMPPVQFPDSAPTGPLRVSWAFVKPGGGLEIRHETVPGGEALAKGWRRTSRVVPPAGARRVAVLVEALGPERWKGEAWTIGESRGR